jgi:uncharacterized damage-inducible protein DinB
MNFKLDEALEILDRTPGVLTHLLSGLSEVWLRGNEGNNTWNALEVVGHLIEAEKDNWIPRIRSILLSKGEAQPFPPFDRFSHLGKQMNIEELLLEFKKYREESIVQLKAAIHESANLEKTAIHPEFGTVTLRELLSTWVVHDLTHINQITRVLAKRYYEDVGPWKAYLSILK